MQLEASGLIFDAGEHPPSERVAYFTSLCRTRTGDILAGFQVGPAKHAPTSSIRFCRSRDGGVTWHELPFRFETVLDGVPGSLAAGEAIEVAPGRLIVFSTWFDRSDPARPLFDPVTEGILRSRQLCAFSDNEGDSWSDWKVVPTPGLSGCATTGPPLCWDNGTLAHAFESFKEFDDPRPARHAAWIVISTDGGESFSAPIQVARHPRDAIYYWDQRLCACRENGEYVALFWTHDLEHKRDLRVHLRRASINGLESPIQETPIQGQIAAPLLSPDGRLLAFVVDRNPPGTMKLWRSADGGSTWSEDDCLTVHTHDERAILSQGREDIDFKQYWEDMGKWTFGHPAMVALDPSRALLAFYAGTPDAMSIHWARVQLG